MIYELYDKSTKVHNKMNQWNLSTNTLNLPLKSIALTHSFSIPFSSLCSNAIDSICCRSVADFHITFFFLWPWTWTFDRGLPNSNMWRWTSTPDLLSLFSFFYRTDESSTWTIKNWSVEWLNRSNNFPNMPKIKYKSKKHANIRSVYMCAHYCTA